MKIVPLTIPLNGKDLLNPEFNFDFIWLDYTSRRHGTGFSSGIMGVLLFHMWNAVEELNRKLIDYKDLLKQALYQNISEKRGKTFPIYISNLNLTNLLFENGRVKNPQYSYSLYCSSKTDLEERLKLTNTNGKEILAFTVDGQFYNGEKTAEEQFNFIKEKIDYPFERYLKNNLQELLDFTKKRSRIFSIDYGTNAIETLCYPEIIEKEIIIDYTNKELPNLFQVYNHNKLKISLSNKLIDQPLKVVRGAVCLGLSQLFNNKNSISSSQIDVIRRGFPREVMNYTKFIEDYNKQFIGLKTNDIIEIIRSSQSILSENLHNPFYINLEGYIPNH